MTIQYHLITKLLALAYISILKYTLERQIPGSNREFCFKKHIDYADGVFFNGAIFWTFCQLDSFCYFDIDREIIHTYPMPKMKREYYCGCMHDHLYLLGTSLGEWHQLDIFQLEKDYSSWSLNYCIDLREQMTIPRKFSVVDITMLFVMAREEKQEPYLGI